MSVTRVIMPKLGLTMDEGRLIAWHKAEGESVTEGEVLFEVETDKAAMEVPATASGFVRRLLAKPDDMVPVAVVVAIITSSADEPVGVAEAMSAAGGAPSASQTASLVPPSPAEPARTPRPTTSPQPHQRAHPPSS